MKILLASLLVTNVLFAAPSVEFLAIGKPSFLKIRGKCPDAQVSTTLVQCQQGSACNTLTADVNLSSCTTGIALRDQHMKEKYLKVSQYPQATLKAKIPTGNGGFSGSLTVSGKTVPVEGRIEDGKIKFETKISAHGIDVPSFMGVTVGDKIEIEATF